VGLLNWLPFGAGSQLPAEPETVEHACPGIARALVKIFEHGKQPEVLDLGQSSSSPALYLADRGARVQVEQFEPPAVASAADDDPEPRPPVTIPQPDGKFDLVLAWEHGDFVPPDRLDEFTAELHRVTAPGGFVVWFARDRPSLERSSEPGRAASYQFQTDDRIVCKPGRGPARPRWTYPNRAIEGALAPLSVQGIHLHQNRMREVVAKKTTR
jgi:hypothetical protein